MGLFDFDELDDGKQYVADKILTAYISVIRDSPRNRQ
jgi:hypothetical protein